MSKKTQFWLRTAGATLAAGTMVLGMTGCNGCGSNTPAPITSAANGSDPADANLATPDGGQPTQVMGQSAAYTPQQSSENYTPRQTYASGQQAPAPIVNGNATRNEAYNYNTQAPDTQANGYYDNGQAAYDQGYNNGQADEYAQTDQAPPELPVYEQPPAPDPDDIWTPGYWGYANTGYYWNPGVWVAAPFVGALWTPGYWGNYGGRYRWHHGFWGRHIGYYGGINYGCGYVGSGYYGGYWNRDHFYYNSAVTRVSPRVTNIYERNVVVNNVHYTAVSNNRVSFNGGRGGVNYQPRPYEVAAMREQHVGPVPAQQQFHREAAMNRANFYADNHGRPAQLALAQPVRTERIAAPAETNRGGFGRGSAQTPGSPNGGSQNPGVQRPGGTGAPNVGFRNGAPGNGLPGAPGQPRTAQIGPDHRNGPEPQRGLMQAPQQHGQPFSPANNGAQTGRIGEAQHNAAAEQQQRAAFQAQHNQGALQEHTQRMQENRSVQPQQPRAVVEQPRSLPEQGQQPRFGGQPQQHIEQPRMQPQQQHMEQPRFQPQPQQQHVEQPRPQFNAQPHFEQHQMPTQQPQQHIEAPRAMPAAPHIEAPRVAPAAAPHMEAPHAGPPAGGGGGHPGGGGHH